MVKVIVKDIRNRIINRDLFDELSGEGAKSSKVAPEPTYEERFQDYLSTRPVIAGRPTRNYPHPVLLPPTEQELARREYERKHGTPNQRRSILNDISKLLPMEADYKSRLRNKLKKLDIDKIEKFKKKLEKLNDEDIIKLVNKILYDDYELSGEGQVFSIMQDEVDEEESTKIYPKYRKRNADTIFNYIRQREIDPNILKPSRKLKEKIELIEKTPEIERIMERLAENENFIDRVMNQAIRLGIDIYDENSFRPFLEEEMLRTADRIYENRQRGLGKKKPIDRTIEKLEKSSNIVNQLALREIKPGSERKLMNMMTEKANVGWTNYLRPYIENTLRINRNIVDEVRDLQTRQLDPSDPILQRAAQRIRLQQQELLDIQNKLYKLKNYLTENKPDIGIALERRQVENIPEIDDYLTEILTDFNNNMEQIEVDYPDVENELIGNGIMDFAGKLFDKFAPKKIKDKVYDVFIGNRLKAFKENVAKENQKNQYSNRM